jgi:hypothetical protein
MLSAASDGATFEKITRMRKNQLMYRSAMVLLAAMGASPARAVPSVPLSTLPASDVHVDVSPLLENSSEQIVVWVERALPLAISRALAARGRTDASVLVRINHVPLGRISGGLSGVSEDQMIGTVTSGGVERPLQAARAFVPAASDSTMIDRSMQYRVVQLSKVFAGWIARGY